MTYPQAFPDSVGFPAAKGSTSNFAYPRLPAFYFFSCNSYFKPHGVSVPKFAELPSSTSISVTTSPSSRAVGVTCQPSSLPPRRPTSYNFGGTNEETQHRARRENEASELSTGHSVHFAPAIEPTIQSCMEAIALAALMFLQQRHL